MIVTKEGIVRDVIPGSPAYIAGLGPGMELIAVNNRKWSKDQMRSALRTGMQSRQPLAILAENGDYIKTYSVDYQGGEQYPHLLRVDGRADILDEIIKPQK